jgi:multidrug efflux pump subunit AcrA (membrane-fusion protein)
MDNPAPPSVSRLRLLLAKIPLPGIVRRHPAWSAGLTVVLLLIGGGVYALMRPAQPELVTAVAHRGDIVRTVEAVGTVISERDLQLQFPVTGVVSEVLVKEGDRVVAGQTLSRLRFGTLAADVASAAAAVQSAQAEFNALLEGTRPEDIAISEAELVSKRASLDVARSTLASAESKLKASQAKLTSLEREAQVSLGGYVSTAGSTASEYIADARTGLEAIDDVFDSIAVQDVLQKHNPGEYSNLRKRQSRVSADLQSAFIASSTASDYEEALADLTLARSAVAAVADLLRQSKDFLLSLPMTSTFTVAVRAPNSDMLATERTRVQTALSGLDAAIKTLRDASASFDTKIAAEEATIAAARGDRDRATADIATFEASVKIAEAQLQLKRAGSRPQDIAAARARVAQEAAKLARARAAVSDTVLTAPIEGTITKVNVKVGEILPTGPAVTMLGSTPYRVEMYVAEVDIPLVMVSQSGSIELDAFPGVFDMLRVNEIGEAATDRDGVPKYRVKLDFLEAREAFRVGMTGDVEIITGERHDVVSVPRRAVIDGRGGGPIVRVFQGGKTVERPVTVGMEGSEGEMEVEGVEEGETVIVLIKN